MRYTASVSRRFIFPISMANNSMQRALLELSLAQHPLSQSGPARSSWEAPKGSRGAVPLPPWHSCLRFMIHETRLLKFIYLGGHPGILQQHTGPHCRVPGYKLPVLAHFCSPEQGLGVKVSENAEEGRSHLENLGTDDFVGSGRAAPLGPGILPSTPLGPACEGKDRQEGACKQTQPP